MRTVLASALASALVVCATGVQAQDTDALQGDVNAFETCFIQLMIDNPDNPMLDVFGPIVCGERHVPMGQTCDAIGYVLFDRRAQCKADDLAFWQEQVSTRSAAMVAKGRIGTGSLYDSGLERCGEIEAEGDDPIDCLIEMNWREVMSFLAADLVADLTGGDVTEGDATGGDE